MALHLSVEPLNTRSGFSTEMRTRYIPLLATMPPRSVIIEDTGIINVIFKMWV